MMLTSPERIDMDHRSRLASKQGVSVLKAAVGRHRLRIVADGSGSWDGACPAKA
jgi:hypothetical protein